MPVTRSSIKNNFENTMESNTFSRESRYRQRCPPRLSINRYQPYQNASITHLPSPASEECVNILAKMNHRVSEEGFYIPSPAVLSTNSYFNFHHSVSNNQHLPPCSPLTPSCAYYNTDTPSFIYPEDHLPPTSIFTASLAQELLQEETQEDQQLNDVQPQTRSYDIASILSLPQQKCEVKTFDLFDKVVDQPDPSIFDLYKSVMTEDLLPMNTFQQSLEVKTCPEIQPLSKPEEAQSSKRKKQHECQYCGKTFRQKSTLTTHERIHTGEKPYHCQYCSKSFSDNSTFVKHVRTHTREKPYTCKTCGKSFAQSGNLNRHNKIHLQTH